MSVRSVFYTANAGFFLTVGDITLAADPFPRRADRGFSALSEEDFQTLCTTENISSPRYIIITHEHPDHYSRSRTDAFLTHHPSSRLIGALEPKQLPATASSPLLLTGDRHTYYFPGITLEFLRLPHEGESFAQVLHYGCIATFTGPAPCRVLFLGDAKPADPIIADWLNGRKIDLALLNFPWVTLPKGRKFIEEHLSSAKIGILHLPYEQDDRNGYVPAAEAAVEKWGWENVKVFREFGERWRV